MIKIHRIDFQYGYCVNNGIPSVYPFIKLAGMTENWVNDLGLKSERHPGVDARWFIPLLVFSVL